MTRVELIKWLVKWRQDRAGSVSAANHSRLLATRSTKWLLRMKRQIEEQEKAALRARAGGEAG